MSGFKGTAGVVHSLAGVTLCAVELVVEVAHELNV
jgi:hypothetical protein